jgi:chromosome segregation ATPase
MHLQQLMVITNLWAWDVGMGAVVMSVPTQQIGIGRLGELVRNLMGRLAPLETATSIHGGEIDRLKDQAEDVQTEVDTLKVMVEMQDGVGADHDRKIGELQKKLARLEADVAAHENTITKMTSTLHGQKIKTGQAKARAGRAERALDKLKASKPRKVTR